MLDSSDQKSIPGRLQFNAMNRVPGTGDALECKKDKEQRKIYKT